MASLNMNATPETVRALLQEVAASQKETDTGARRPNAFSLESPFSYERQG